MYQKPFPPPYDILTELLVAARQSVGMTQEELAERLLIGQSAVSKVERGVQRLDLVELHHWLTAIGTPGLSAFVQAFEKRVGEQVVAERSWMPSRDPTVRPVRQPKGASK
jgi:transcriptional regulator with XRE-family HTH domain